jgi:hypothetical protein
MQVNYCAYDVAVAGELVEPATNNVYICRYMPTL